MAAELQVDRPITPEDFGTPLTFMVRIWSRTVKTGKEARNAAASANPTPVGIQSKGVFLGRVVITSDQLLNPSKGMRAYHLENDHFIARTKINERNKIIAKFRGKVPDSEKAKHKDLFDEQEITGQLFVRMGTWINYVVRDKLIKQ